MVVHCFAGISRSTAGAYVAACALNPERDEMQIAWDIRRASRTAQPNSRIVSIADRLLKRDGRMVRAIDAIGLGDAADRRQVRSGSILGEHLHSSCTGLTRASIFPDKVKDYRVKPAMTGKGGVVSSKTYGVVAPDVLKSYDGLGFLKGIIDGTVPQSADQRIARLSSR